MICCWGAKGGAGTSVVAAALALVLARRPAGALLVDLRGDQPALLGVREPSGPGVADWLVRGGEAPPDALGRLEVSVADGLRLLPRGSWNGPVGGMETQLEVLVPLLRAERRAVVVDAGCLVAPGDGGAPPSVAAAAAFTTAADLSLLVVRPCYLALRRAVAIGVRPGGVVMVGEGWRALQPDDVAHVVGAPVVASIGVEATVARVVDAGLLTARLPRVLERALLGVPGVADAAR